MAEPHVVPALLRKRAEIAGRIEHTQTALRQRIIDLDNLDAELKRRGVSYKQLAERLEAMGIHETERNINNKISRGGFSATLFVQCLVAIGCRTLHLEDV